MSQKLLILDSNMYESQEFHLGRRLRQIFERTLSVVSMLLMLEYRLDRVDWILTKQQKTREHVKNQKKSLESERTRMYPLKPSGIF